MKRLLAAALGGLLIGSTASPVLAQATSPLICDARDKVVSTLGTDYSESPVSMGLARNGTVIEVFTSVEGTWTIIMTQPVGISCLVASGNYWESLPKPIAGLGM
jgi:hypothetical protein